MKTMMSLDGKRIFRISDENAAKLYHSMEAKYVPKSVWKESVRDVEKNHDETSTEKSINKKSNKMSKATKRHLKKSKDII